MLTLEGMTVDDNGADTGNNNPILVKFKITPKKDYSFYPAEERVLHPSLRSLAGQEITVKLIPNKTWAKPIAFEDMENALKSIKYNDEKGGSILEFDKINLKEQGDYLWLTNTGKLEITTNDMAEAIKANLNKNPLVETDKLIIEPIDEDITYWDSIKIFYKDVKLVPKDNYGFDINNFGKIRVNYVGSIGYDDIIGQYSTVENDLVRISFMINRFPSK